MRTHPKCKRTVICQAHWKIALEATAMHEATPKYYSVVKADICSKPTLLSRLDGSITVSQ